MKETHYKLLIEKVDTFIRKYYKDQLLKGSLYAVGLVILFYLSITILEFFAQFGVFARTILFYSLILSTGFILIKFIGVPLGKLYKYGNIITHDQAAAIIGRHFPEVKDKLLNTLQLENQMLPEQESAWNLVRASIEQKSKKLKSIHFASAIDLSNNKIYIKYAAIPLALVVFILLAAPSIIKEGTMRIVKHDLEFVKKSPFTFIIKNPAMTAVQNEDFKLAVQILGSSLPNTVYVEWGNKRSRLVRESKEEFSHVFKNLQNPIKFNLNAGGYSSKEFDIKVLPNPMVVDFTTYLKYPSYIKKENEAFHNIGDLVLPEGTSVTWAFKTVNTETVKIRLQNQLASQLIELPTNDVQESNYSATIAQATNYSVVTANNHVQNKDSMVFLINVIPDQYPAIDVVEHRDSNNFTSMFFTGQVKDDYGLSRITFNTRVSKSSNNQNRGVKVVNLSLKSGQTETQFFHHWDLEELNFQPGDDVEYFFEVWDNDGINGSKSSRSAIRKYKIPGFNELADLNKKDSEQIKKAIQDNILLAKKVKQDLEKIRNKMMEKSTLGWEEKRNIQNVLKNQNDLQNNIDKINKKLGDNLLKQSTFRKVNESIVEKQQKLQDLFNDIMSDEMKDLFRQMEELMAKMDKAKLEEMLKNMDLSAKDIEKELDRSLEIFKQLALEQKLADAIEKLKNLEKKQNELGNDTKHSNKALDSLGTEQQQLNNEFNDITKDIADAEKMNTELEYPNDFAETREEEGDIKEQMDNSEDQLQNGNKKKASDFQGKAAEGMGKLADKLNEMLEEMDATAASEDIHALRQLLENIVQLSFDQEKLMGELKRINQNNPGYIKLAKDQKKLKDDASLIEDSLFALSKRVVEIEPFVNREITKINHNLELAIKLMEERKKGQATSRQQYVMTSANNLALLLNEILENMQEAMTSDPNKSCKKPGCKKSNCQKPGHGKPSMSSMRQMQERLSRNIKNMKEGKGKPGIKGRGGNSQMFVKMAAEQEALRNELNRINQELNKDGKGGMGNLERLAQLMEQTEQDLVNKRITQETVQRQQEIITRLLQAEKAEREREFEDKRKAIEGKSKEISNPIEFLEYKKVKMKEMELLKTVPPSFNPFYKLKVDEYFNNYKVGKK